MKIGLDIGYSGVKVVYGTHGNDRTSFTLPVGAAPERILLSMGDANYGGERVLAGGEIFRAGIEPYLIPGGGRVLDADYTDSVQYLALFYAVLAKVGASRIDCLATGLPVSLYKSQATRNRVIAQFKGVHRIDETTTVEVCDVRVFPQPVGTYITHVASTPNGSEVMANKSVLVVDPGFFSVDSVVIKHGAPFAGGAAMSTAAMSRVLELVDEQLTRSRSKHTALPGKFMGDLERALRSGNTVIYVGGKPVDIARLLEDASYQVARQAVSKIKASVRTLDFELDMVLLGGGGAQLFADGITEEFPDQERAVVFNAPLANASGFYFLII